MFNFIIQQILKASRNNSLQPLTHFTVIKNDIVSHFQGFEIASITGIEKFTSPCPENKKVLGCHIRAPVYQEEFFRQAYPSEDGSQCHCYAEHDAR